MEVLIPITPLPNSSSSTSNRTDSHTDILGTSQQLSIVRDRQTWQIKLPARLNDMMGYVLSVVDEIECSDPISYHEAIEASDSNK